MLLFLYYYLFGGCSSMANRCFGVYPQSLVWFTTAAFIYSRAIKQLIRIKFHVILHDIVACSGNFMGKSFSDRLLSHLILFRLWHFGQCRFLQELKTSRKKPQSFSQISMCPPSFWVRQVTMSRITFLCSKLAGYWARKSALWFLNILASSA